MNNNQKLKYQFFMYVRGSITSQLFMSFIKEQENFKYILNQLDYEKLINYSHREYEQVTPICRILFKYFKEEDYYSFNLKITLDSVLNDLNDAKEIRRSLQTITRLYQSRKNPYLKEYAEQYEMKSMTTDDDIMDFLPKLVIDTKKLIYNFGLE